MTSRINILLQNTIFRYLFGIAAVAGFFEPDKYPAITFVTTSATGSEGKGTVTGDLTFHGVTKPVTLDVQFNGYGSGFPVSGPRMGFSGSGKVKRSEFGVNGGRPFAGDVVDLLFEVEFVKKSSQ